MSENKSVINKPGTVNENKMGVMPISRLLITMTVPIMLSMLVQALYNIVDSIYVSRVGENALTALSLAFPIQILMIAVITGTGVGINALLSKSLGEKNQDRVNKTAINGIFLGLISSIAFAVFGLFFTRLFFMSQTNITEIIDYGTSYLSIVTICSFGLVGQITFERLLQSTGRTFLSMIAQIFGAVINIILDPILIFGYFGLPKLGVAGAAVATVISQFLAMGLAILFNLTLNKEIKLKFRGFKPSIDIIARIYAVGIPTAIMISIGSVMTYGLNRILISFTPTANAVFGVYYRLQSFIYMPVFGLNNGMIPIISYNYGAANKDRIVKTVKLSIIYATVIMIAGFALFQFFSVSFLSMFNATDDMMAIGVPALRIISISFIFAGFCIVSTSVYQALGSGLPSMFVSLARQLLALLPLAYLLSKTGGLDAVWWSFPIAEIVSVTLSVIFLKYFYRTKIKPLSYKNAA